MGSKPILSETLQKHSPKICRPKNEAAMISVCESIALWSKCDPNQVYKLFPTNAIERVQTAIGNRQLNRLLVFQRISQSEGSL